MTIAEKTLRTHGKIRKEYRPADDEPFMCSRQRAYFRGKLLAWRNEILRSTKETLRHLHEETAQHPDLADRASTEMDRGVELRARDRQRKR
jgi:DnaK suppressor protein